MTFLSYDPPKTAPFMAKSLGFIWYAQCDVCKFNCLGPFTTSQVRADQRVLVEAKGWRYEANPCKDTCVDCLNKEVPEDDDAVHP